MVNSPFLAGFLEPGMTKWLILLFALLALSSFAIIFSPKKKLIDEIKIIEEE